MRILLSIVGAVILTAFVILLGYWGLVDLFDYWTQLAVALSMAAFGLLVWGFKPHFSKNVSLKIKNLRVEIQNLDTKHEFKNLFFDVENNGKTEAKGCRIKIVVKGIWDNTREIVNPNLPAAIDRGVFNIMPNYPVSINLGQVTKEQPTTCEIYTEDPDAKRLGRFVTLTKGTYKLEISLVGRNFTHKKFHRFRLDLTSWKNIGIKLDC